MTPNGFFRVCQNGEGPTFARLTWNKCGQSLILYYIKQIDSMLPCISPVIDHRGRQNVVRTSVTHSAIASCATFLFSPHFDVIYDLLLDRCTATWNLFVKQTIETCSLLLKFIYLLVIILSIYVCIEYGLTTSFSSTRFLTDIRGLWKSSLILAAGCR